MKVQAAGSAAFVERTCIAVEEVVRAAIAYSSGRLRPLEPRDHRAHRVLSAYAPDQIAAHFGSDGRPNGWYNHADFIKIIIFRITIPAALFPDLLVRLPDATLDIANKSYGLAPERRADTVAFMRRRLRRLAVLVLGMMALVISMGLLAALTVPSQFPEHVAWMVPPISYS